MTIVNDSKCEAYAVDFIGVPESEAKHKQRHCR